MTNEKINKICEEYNIENYIINEDGSIDVGGTVDLTGLKLNILPLKFRNVMGGFYCQENQLTTLEGSPKSVNSHFNCSENQLTTLEGGPESVGGDFICYNNKLKTLKGAPESIRCNFICVNNQLSTLEHLSIVNGIVFCDNYLFEEMIKITKPINRKNKKYYKYLKIAYQRFFRGNDNEYDEYFKPIERSKKLKQLGI